MKRLTVALAGLASISCGVGVAATAPMSFKSYRDWEIVLPHEQQRRVSGEIVLEGVQKAFRTAVKGTSLQVDKDGDGGFDVAVEGESGFITLRTEKEDGAKYGYSLRLRNAGSGWQALPGGAAVGKIGGQQVRVIDQNLNGRFDDYGQDAMIVGRGKQACFLSEVVNIRGDLFSLKVAPDGSSVEWAPFEGEHGRIDMGTGLASKAKLLGAVVVSQDGKRSFTLTERSVVVPSGKYRLYRGRLGLGRHVATFSPGESEAITVSPNETETVALGEPINIDFKFVRQPGRVIMAPQLVRYVGRAGEVYDQWTPFGGSPQFDVRDVETGMQIALAVFGGS